MKNKQASKQTNKQIYLIAFSESFTGFPLSCTYHYIKSLAHYWCWRLSVYTPMRVLNLQMSAFHFLYPLVPRAKLIMIWTTKTYRESCKKNQFKSQKSEQTTSHRKRKKKEESKEVLFLSTPSVWYSCFLGTIPSCSIKNPLTIGETDTL